MEHAPASRLAVARSICTHCIAAQHGVADIKVLGNTLQRCDIINARLIHCENQQSPDNRAARYPHATHLSVVYIYTHMCVYIHLHICAPKQQYACSAAEIPLRGDGTAKQECATDWQPEIGCNPQTQGLTCCCCYSTRPK